MRINFNLKPAGDYQQLYVIIRHNGLTFKKYCKFNLQKEDWDAKNQRVRAGRSQHSLINAFIANQKQKIEKYIDDCHRANKYPTLHDARHIISGHVIAETARTLSDGIQLIIDRGATSSKDRTIRGYRMLKAQVEEYQTLSKTVVLLQHVDETFYHRFIKFLLEERGNTNNTILRKLVAIKTVMIYASKKGLVSGREWDVDPFLNKSEANRTPLSEEERGILWNYRTLDGYARTVLDAFLLSMYTGLRFSDLSQLKPVHFKKLPTGEHYISLTQNKGDKSHTVAIPDFIYTHISERLMTEKILFPLGFNNEANRQLKKIAKDAGLNREMEMVTKKGSKTDRRLSSLHKEISFHFARYTYTNILQLIGTDPVYIQKNLNHTDFKTTSGYLRMNETARISDTCKRMVI